MAGNFHFAPGKSFQQSHVHGKSYFLTLEKRPLKTFLFVVHKIAEVISLQAEVNHMSSLRTEMSSPLTGQMCNYFYYMNITFKKSLKISCVFILRQILEADQNRTKKNELLHYFYISEIINMFSKMLHIVLCFTLSLIRL